MLDMMTKEQKQRHRNYMVKCLKITFYSKAPVASGEVVNFDPPINGADQGIVESTGLLEDDLYFVTCRGHRAADV